MSQIIKFIIEIFDFQYSWNIEYIERDDITHPTLDSHG